MVAPRLVLVLGDQLTPSIAALKAADMDRDIVVMAEVAAETGYVAHHPKKIAFVLSAMRKFAARLQADGWRVCYTRLDDEDNAGSIGGELLRRAEEHGAKEVLATEPGEWRLIEALRDHPLTLHIQQDDRFICSHSEFETWAEGRKSLRMEYFYREMRKKTGLLMDGDDPAGGAWNFDSDNRKSPPKGLEGPEPPRFEPDGVVRQVLDLVEARFSENFGKLRPFRFATDADEAETALDHFIAHALPCFGDYQDAMVRGQDLLFHSLLSPYMNVGLLDPLEVCRRVEAAWQAGDVPINAAEGFIRQIIGWREYVRGIYFLEGPDYTSRNALDHTRKLPALYWGGETRMRCLRECVDVTRREAYAHHIQRLMVTGNFALLAGVDPGAVHEWYLEVYADAYEWVEAPNTIGMSQFADGGIIASKPYVSSGNYIAKMSDYCKSCTYGVTVKTGEGACPFNLLYWHFLIRHRERFEDNPRMAQMYRTWERMDAEKRETVLSEAEAFLERMEAGEVV